MKLFIHTDYIKLLSLIMSNKLETTSDILCLLTQTDYIL